jgi:DTW domain-containing protein YfiP
MQTSPNDYLRVNIDHPSLDSPVWLVFTQAKNLDEDKILNKIEGVQQSKKEFVISDGGWKSIFFM